MKLHTTAAALVLAALPVFAQANSVAAEEAFQANHEPLKVSSDTGGTAAQGNQAFNRSVEGVSVALAETQQNIQEESSHRTDFPATSNDQPELGHAADW